MPNADFDTAVAKAARLLSRSDHPVIGGNIADAAAAIAAFRLAKAIGGVVDHVAAEASLHDQALLADTGSMLVSPGEARQRADTFLLIGDEPLKAWPDLPDFLFGEGPRHFFDETPKRRIVALSSRTVGRRHGGTEVVWRKTDAGDIPVLLGALRARIVGHPVAQAVDRAETDRLAETLKAAQFGVALWSAGELDALTLEMLTGLIKDLNAETRWSGLSIVEDTGAVCATMVASWMNGFPLRTGFGRVYPEHDAWRFEARRLVESGEADALVATKIDRVSRSVADFATLVCRANTKGWALVVLDIGLDLTTPMGKFTANVLCAAAELERDMISQRTRDGLAAAKAKGVKIGSPRVLPDDVAERITELRQGGATLTAIADRLNGEGVPTARGGDRWWPSSVRAVLHRQPG